VVLGATALLAAWGASAAEPITKIEARKWSANTVRERVASQLGEILFAPSNSDAGGARPVEQIYWTRPRAGSHEGLCKADRVMLEVRDGHVSGVSAETRYGALGGRSDLPFIEDRRGRKRAAAACARVDPSRGGFFRASSDDEAVESATKQPADG